MSLNWCLSNLDRVQYVILYTLHMITQDPLFGLLGSYLELKKQTGAQRQVQYLLQETNLDMLCIRVSVHQVNCISDIDDPYLHS